MIEVTTGNDGDYTVDKAQGWGCGEIDLLAEAVVCGYPKQCCRVVV